MLWIFALIACGPATPDDTEDPWVAPAGGVVELVTRDDVKLAADYYPADAANRPAIVLLHMIPPTFDRTSWPADFITLLHDNNWNVVALDRRGAGDSEGVAVEAYEGENGRYDVEAVTAMLAADGAGDLVILGASNGTTSTLDYASWAAEEGLMAPKALGFLSGGPYTENQTGIATAPQVPAFFSHENSDRERMWAESVSAINRDGWELWPYDPGAHGTNQFGDDETFGPRVETFLKGALGE